ncbi:DUF1156 domain-containing protein [Providencia stuartii]|uniref:anti-phage-associated DUF1156 domain-containing protein n=2 Tax=Enterobacterales TaxID=91347 RepID=UPI000CE6637C|nr:anti-phage-associated DUF1156 domain-containing protein [Providencia stuartii]AVE40848.1 DNA methylase [Providencia stuartii]MTC91462.1 DUF1156 domain-containing protein [Providencia stuartii]
MALQPFEWKDKPALIERLFPVQKISAESFKEQSAVQSKALTALGSYWKGRKPLILNKACILGSLLPATSDGLKDLEIFEMLMGMDPESMKTRIEEALPVSKRESIGNYLELPYHDQVRAGKRPEEIGESLFSLIWGRVNAHLGTSARSIPELVEEMGIARFGRRPKVADVFSGSGQIPFEAARLGCDVYASDLNPIACLLTWGSFNIVGANSERRNSIRKSQLNVVKAVSEKINALQIDADGKGWSAKAYLYCVEVKCPESGWSVPLLPTMVVSASKFVVVKLVPDHDNKRYGIDTYYCEDKEEMDSLAAGTVESGYLVHSPNGTDKYRVSIKSIRGDYKEGKENKNRLRMWEKEDFTPRADDIFQERLYCIQWMKRKSSGKQFDYEFRAVTDEDLVREKKVIEYVSQHLSSWQADGYVSDMVIEKGYNTDQPIRERGWTHWHHLYSPRQILMLALVHEEIKKQQSNSAELEIFFSRLLDWSTKLCRYGTGASRESIAQTFYNQALNTFYNYGVRPFSFASTYLLEETYNYPVSSVTDVNSHPAQNIDVVNDIYVTDPPYGDAVKYEEITEFFIAWLRKNPPKEFAHWTWDSRRSIAIKGEDDGFRSGMVAAYRQMAQRMPDNGLQVLMFTHQSGAIWADMANIIWASGLQVTAAWYVVTETDAAIRGGSNVKGTIILILRKRHQALETFRDDLGWEIEEAVREQVESLIGLDKKVRDQGAEGLYTDADLQMAGYAAALKVLTAYSRIDGKDMVTEAEAPRQKGKKTFVDELIDFAVQTAVQFLVPVGFEKGEWQKLQAVERFYLKMAEMEHQGAKTLDNYQNFAKAFKVHHFDQLMSDASKANSARLKLSTEFRSAMMAGDAEMAGTPLRALLYALFELSKEVEVDDVLLHLMENCPNYLPNKQLLAKMADYLAEKREGLKGTKTFNPEQEASCARVLAEAIRNQRL